MKKIILGAHVVFLIVALFASSVFPVEYVSAQIESADAQAVAAIVAEAPVVAPSPIVPPPRVPPTPIPGDVAPTPTPGNGGTFVDADPVQNTAPVLTVSPSAVRVTVGNSFDESMIVVTATDIEEGNITSRISIVSDEAVNTNVIGTYTRVYKVEDLEGLSDTKTRVVNVVRAPVSGEENNLAPVITLSENPVTVVVGGTFTEPTVTVTDDHDADIASRLVTLTNQTVDVNTVGSYSRVYYVSDSKGLSDTETRIVNVVADDSNSNNNSSGGRRGSSGGRRSTTGGQVLGDSTSSGLVLGAEDFQFLTNMGRGMSGNDVFELQKRLRSEGYFVYPTNTGYFGPFTQIAVMLYQVKHNIIPVSGYVGPITRAVLNTL